jgi:exodeoxyribonuclease V beta subunit
VLRWLSAVANPLDGALARAALPPPPWPVAGRTGAPVVGRTGVGKRVEQLKALHIIWQRQGVLAMLRRFIHDLQLPATLLQQPGGERRLTNLLHLAELLQSPAASSMASRR